MNGLILLVSLVSATLAVEVCYPPCLGCFNDEPPFNTRPLPENPDDQQFEWQLYTQNNRNNPVSVTLPVDKNNPPRFFDGSKRTHFLIHGWNSGAGSLALTRDALLDLYDDNVFVLDWSTGAGRAFYPQSASNTQVAGACSAYIAQELVDDLSKVHCTGHSLGGQSCGYMGFRLHDTSGEPQMGRATGLDPAGPWFDLEDSTIRIDATDAIFVDNIHTNGESLGIGKPIADVDFYPNKGERQPGCNTDSCDHSLCKNFFAASLSSSCEFTSSPCSSKEDADAGLCDSCSGNDCQSMGYYSVDRPGRGVYYLQTQADYPYCL